VSLGETSSLRRAPGPAWAVLAPAVPVAILAAALALAAGGCARTVPPPTTPPPVEGQEAPVAAGETPGTEAEAPAAPEEPVAPLPAAEPEIEAAPEPPPPGGLAPGPAVPLLLRVGLASDLDEVTLPCCGGDLVVATGGRPLAVLSPIRVSPAGSLTGRAVYRLQVAALQDERQAEELARRLGAGTGLPADAHFDAGTGFYRVRTGRFPSREAAETARRRLAGQGFAEAWVVSEGGEVHDAALRLVQGTESATVPGRWLAVDRQGGDGSITVLGRRYRGRLLVYLNDRGKLNLIDELPLEDYLRGVVPAEMGPEVYPRLEAIKAQAVAARTYTLRNLGEFEREGYDICATPRCQVYKGMDAEHPMSDRAIEETAGQVLLYRGELVDARYSAVCGGHTEDVQVVFPLERYPYLAGVPCLEAGVDRLAGSLPRGAPFPETLARRLFPPPATAGDGTPDAAASLGGRLSALAAAAGLPAAADRLGSLARREVQRYVASVFDLALDARLFVRPEDLPYLLEDPPADWTEEDRRRAAYLVRSGLLAGPLDRPLDDAEIERMVFRLAELLRLVEPVDGSYRALAGRRLTLTVDGEERAVELPAGVATFRRYGEALGAGDLALVPGDRLTLYRRGERVEAVVQEVDLDGVAYDRSSHWSSWSRFRSDRRLAELVEERYPGLGFTGFDLLGRGVSGRVGAIRIRGRGGKTVDVEGLAVRWTLDVPDTRFTVKRLSPDRGETGYLFTGSGWGHGVGMCQVGAFGMAGRGHDYRRILQHYYTGVTLARVREAPPRWAGPGDGPERPEEGETAARVATAGER
jgi:stage II sporulation protein D